MVRSSPKKVCSCGKCASYCGQYIKKKSCINRWFCSPAITRPFVLLPVPDSIPKCYASKLSNASRRSPKLSGWILTDSLSKSGKLPLICASSCPGMNRWSNQAMKESIRSLHYAALYSFSAKSSFCVGTLIQGGLLLLVWGGQFIDSLHLLESPVSINLNGAFPNA